MGIIQNGEHASEEHYGLKFPVNPVWILIACLGLLGMGVCGFNYRAGLMPGRSKARWRRGLGVGYRVKMAFSAWLKRSVFRV